jgi:glycosyltransferase involved in cell wall biosynthesis
VPEQEGNPGHVRTSRNGNRLISVIVPVHNRERYLADAVESVLSQDFRPIEIIVVNDGSTDRSAEVAKRFSARIRYYCQSNRGIGAARNAGVDRACGEFLAFLDSDDLWVEDKLTRQAAAFDRDESLDMVFGHVQQFVSPELPEEAKKRLKCPRDKMPGRVPGAMLIRSRSFFRVGYFGLAIGEVLDWILRADEVGLRSTMLPEVVLKRRLHSTNSVVLDPNSRVQYARYLKAALDRRRSESAGHHAGGSADTNDPPAEHTS